MRQAFLALVTLELALAQAPQRRPNSYHSTGGAASPQRGPSPEVRADKTIVFRLSAPKAREVSLNLQGKPQPMKQLDDGLWSITVGPLAPEIYEYSFTIDGARVLDMSNTAIKTGRTLTANFVEVPGNPPRFDEVQDVPHGAIQIRTYRSTPLQKLRRLYVYTPPQYDSEPGRRFPVLYLRHGSGDDEATWSGDGGRAGVILENLVAQKRAVPMLIVMSNGDTDGTWGGGSGPEGMEILGKEQLGDIMPLVEKNYRVMPGRENRAIAGLSMGGGQAFTIGLRHLESFAWVGEFSSGLVSDNQFDLAKHLPGFLEDAAATNRKVRLLFLSCGEEDPRMPGQLNLVDLLKEHGIKHVWYSTPGAHEWKVWRHSLAEFMMRAFR
jgi:enterochelin esterase-like enzyme